MGNGELFSSNFLFLCLFRSPPPPPPPPPLPPSSFPPSSVVLFAPAPSFLPDSDCATPTFTPLLLHSRWLHFHQHVSSLFFFQTHHPSYPHPPPPTSNPLPFPSPPCLISFPLSPCPFHSGFSSISTPFQRGKTYCVKEKVCTWVLGQKKYYTRVRNNANENKVSIYIYIYVYIHIEGCD